jgi:protein-S-isoprenylcysteine O-methyltransferase Ste14
MPASSPSRGGGWVVAQSALTVAVVVLAFVPPRWPEELRVVGIPLLVVGALGFAWSAWALGRSLTPYPKPREIGVLVRHGPYRYVRHPMYAAGALFFLGLGLSTTVPATAAAVALALLWWRKAVVEERYLDERFAEYAEYRKRVRLPF